MDVHIKRLRDHFDEEKDGIRIVTVRGVGYKLRRQDEIVIQSNSCHDACRHPFQ